MPRRAAWPVVSVCMTACADPALVVLGSQSPDTFRFGRPELIAELASSAKTDNPSPSADLREIIFTSERGGTGADIWRATRSDPTGPFDPPSRLTELSSAGTETSPVLSPDGLACWFASDRAGAPGQLDVWIARRSERQGEWSEPRLVPSLSSNGRDIPRPLGDHAQIMPLASDRDASPNLYQTYFARIGDTPEAFEPPVLRDELRVPAVSAGDAFLTDDGLVLFYVRGPAFGPADLFVAARRSVDEAFGYERALTDLNTPADERDPWLSSDGAWLFFSSDRTGQYQIYVASVRRDASLLGVDAGAP